MDRNGLHSILGGWVGNRLDLGAYFFETNKYFVVFDLKKAVI